MASFFEKLIGAETEAPKITPKRPVGRKAAPKEKNAKIKAAPRKEEAFEAKIAEEPPEYQEQEEILKEEFLEKTQEKKETTKRLAEKPLVKEKEEKEEPEENEGQLTIDVYETTGEIIIQSTIGGVKPSDVEVIIENGMVKIAGRRVKNEIIEKGNYLIQECHWGSFSRQFVLPAEVDASRAEASLKEGVLTIKIPKIQKEKVMRLLIK